MIATHLFSSVFSFGNVTVCSLLTVAWKLASTVSEGLTAAAGCEKRPFDNSLKFRNPVRLVYPFQLTMEMVFSDLITLANWLDWNFSDPITLADWLDCNFSDPITLTDWLDSNFSDPITLADWFDWNLQHSMRTKRMQMTDKWTYGKIIIR